MLFSHTGSVCTVPVIGEADSLCWAGSVAASVAGLRYEAGTTLPEEDGTKGKVTAFLVCFITSINEFHYNRVLELITAK